jgi:hypothetical protein
MTKRGRPRSKAIPTEVMHCEHHGRDCEHRQWRRGVDSAGQRRLVWICAERQNEANKAAYAAREGSRS